MRPSDEGPRPWRASYAILGVAGIVIATVFAVVASLASKPVSHVQPLPDMPGPVVGDSTTSAVSPVPPDPQVTATTAAVVAPSTTKPPSSRRNPTTTTATAQPAPLPPAKPQAPVATFTAKCNGVVCTFDGTGSADPDGSIIYYAWGFGDDKGDEGSRKSIVSHEYPPGAKTYKVTLVVMDNSGKIGQTSRNVTVGG